ncbi:MAG: putative bifunctional diguanylate cyclase/phosphodiesterase [Alphaproteobacteria bacterium]
MLPSTSRDESLAELERLRAAVDGSGDLVYSWDLATDRIEWAGRAADFFGLSLATVPCSGDSFHGRINPEDLPARMQALSEHFAGGTGYDCEYRVRDSDGEFRWIHDRGTVEISPGGTPVRLSGMMRLVTGRKQNESRLEHLANYDDLTGHYNKLRLREALDYSLQYSLRYGPPGAFLAVGIDKLDRINTAYGSVAGDRVLIEVASRLDQSLRSTDVIGRLGSDRFGIVLAFCSPDDAAMIGERIVDAMRQSPVVIGTDRLHVTLSVGLVHFPDQARTSFDVIINAEAALLKAKSAGRDCVQPYEMSEEQRLNNRANMELGEQVTEALKEDRLVFAYQPVVDAVTHEVRYYECLLRMLTRDGSVVAAGRFVPVVERLGLMRALDRRALELVIQDLETHPDVTLAFNISGVTAADRSWLRALMARLKGRRDLAARMMIEITETAALFDIDDTAHFVSVLRDLGCEVALDDFGAGYTTFHHLKALTVDVVKIDGSFVHDLTHSAENQLFIRNLLGLARVFNLITVAECVETNEEAALLASEGVDLLQGYFFGKPELTPVWRRQTIVPLSTPQYAPAPAANAGG